MSNEDSFINEVTEEVRRDRLFKLFRKYGWIGVVVVVGAVGGTTWNEWRKSSAEAEAQAAGDAVVAAMTQADVAARRTALEAVPVGDNAGRRAVVAMLAADSQMDEGNAEAALAAYESLAADGGLPGPWRDLATMKAALAGADILPPEERIARLNALVLGGGPFRLLAEEQIALAEVEAGETEAAIARLRDIAADAQTSQDLRRRASQLIVALGGSLTSE